MTFAALLTKELRLRLRRERTIWAGDDSAGISLYQS